MRVRVNSKGVVTQAGDELVGDDTIRFPTNWDASRVVGLQVVTGLSGARLLLADTQIIAREENAQVLTATGPGQAGPPGPPGLSVELRTNGANLEWRQTGGTWAALTALSTITGPQGAPGKSAELRMSAGGVEWRQSGDTTWSPLVPTSAITGPAGTNGANGVNGKSVELRATSTALEWRQEGGTWAALTSLASITGPAGSNGTSGAAGKSVELRNTGTAIEWRQEGGTWVTLSPLSALTGPAGPPADMTRVAALESAVSALQAQRLDGTTGQATLTTNLLGGGTANVVVPFVRALPDTSYVAVAIVDGPVSLGGNLVPVYPITNKLADRCTVTVKNNALIALGATATVTVVAIRSGV